MKVLIIGGTGTMGAPLVEILSRDKDNIIDIISRHDCKSSISNIHYIVADAFDSQNMKNILRKNPVYDAIVDFMVYQVSQYKEILDMFLQNTKQYILMSTACIYQEPTAGKKITEETPRLIDSYSEEKKHNLKSYHIMKSNLDDIVFASPLKNWTMIQPHITYNTNKFLFVLWHKDVWLYRALNYKQIVLPRDAMSCIQTLTFGNDVAYAISKLIGNKKALGEIVNIASNKTITWQQVTDSFLNAFENIFGIKPKIKWIENAQTIYDAIKDANDYNMQDHLVRREFDLSKLYNIISEELHFTEFSDNIEYCIRKLAEKNKDTEIKTDGIINGYMDRITHSRTSLNDISGKRGKLLYLCYRMGFTPKILVNWLANYK